MKGSQCHRANKLYIYSIFTIYYTFISTSSGVYVHAYVGTENIQSTRTRAVIYVAPFWLAYTISLYHFGVYLPKTSSPYDMPFIRHWRVENNEMNDDKRVPIFDSPDNITIKKKKWYIAPPINTHRHCINTLHHSNKLIYSACIR